MFCKFVLIVDDGLKIDKVTKKKEGSGINFKYFLR